MSDIASNQQIPTDYPDIEPVDFYDENWKWEDIYSQVAWGLNEHTAPRAYRVTDYLDGNPQFRAVITQRDQAGNLQPPFSMITIYSYVLFELVESKCKTLPNIIKVVFLALGPDSSQNRNMENNLANIICSISYFLELFSTLRSVVLPIDFLVSGFILLSLRSHPGLHILEITSSETQPVNIRLDSNRLPLTLVPGLSAVQHHLQKITIPASVISPDLLRFFGGMQDLRYLKISPVGGYDGNYFVDMIVEHGISSAYAFYPLQVLDVNTSNIYPSKLRSLTKYFPGIDYV